MRSSLALAHRHDATLWDLLLHLHTDMMLRYQIFSWPWARVGCGVCGITFAGSCTQTLCYAMREFAFAFFSKYDHELFQFQEHFTFGSYKRAQIGVISETSPCF